MRGQIGEQKNSGISRQLLGWLEFRDHKGNGTVPGTCGPSRIWGVVSPAAGGWAVSRLVLLRGSTSGIVVQILKVSPGLPGVSWW